MSDKELTKQTEGTKEVIARDEFNDISPLYDYLVEDLTQKQIGEKYGVSQQTISNRIRRILSNEKVLNSVTAQWKKIPLSSQEQK